MSRFYDTSGLNHPVTILQVDNCKVGEVKTFEKNGYNSVGLSSGTAKKSNKPLKGFLKKNKLVPSINQRNLSCQIQNNTKLEIRF